MEDATKVLVDTCVLLDDPDVLMRIEQKGGLAFLTSTVLDELDFNKSGNSPVNANARMIFREFNIEAPAKLSNMPTGEPLRGQDILTRFAFRKRAVYLVARDEFRSRSNNDAKIIELAKDYGMVLITRDKGMKVRAEALGVKVAFWTGPDESSPTNRPQNNRLAQRRTPSNSEPSTQPSTNLIEPFAIHKEPIDEPDTPIAVNNLPGAGDTVRLTSGVTLRLGRQISAGGEGIIYETELAGQVCKVYHHNRLTQLKKKKIELMVSRRINRPGICWPSKTVTNSSGEFVGYIMPRAYGQTMQSAMFVKPKLEKTFPQWTRRDLVNIAGTFIDHVWFLHQHNIIIGDINPMNLLVTEKSEEVWMVDTDSFQIEGFPCPVGTGNFTPPDIQGLNYAKFLRTVDHELFAVATMIFMILFPGKPPYSQQGGGSSAENIKSRNFPYRFYKEAGQSAPEVSGKDAPQGTWQYIWANLPNLIRKAFFNTFHENRPTSVAEWTDLLCKYRDQLNRGNASDVMFPLGFPIRDPVLVSCAKCSNSFDASQVYVDKLTAEGKSVWCPKCANRVRMEKLALQSQRTTEQVTGKPDTLRSRSNSLKSGTKGASQSTARNTSSRVQPKPQSSSASRPPPVKPSYTAKPSNQKPSVSGIFGIIFRSFFK